MFRCNALHSPGAKNKKDSTDVLWMSRTYTCINFGKESWGIKKKLESLSSQLTREVFLQAVSGVTRVINITTMSLKNAREETGLDWLVDL